MFGLRFLIGYNQTCNNLVLDCLFFGNKMFLQDITLKVAGVKSGIFNIYVITFKTCESDEIAYFTLS